MSTTTEQCPECGGKGGFVDVCDLCQGLEARCCNPKCRDGQVAVACDVCGGSGTVPGSADVVTDDNQPASHQAQIRALFRQGCWNGLRAIEAEMKEVGK